jgi:hypothetical protein
MNIITVAVLLAAVVSCGTALQIQKGIDPSGPFLP